MLDFLLYFLKVRENLRGAPQLSRQAPKEAQESLVVRVSAQLALRRLGQRVKVPEAEELHERKAQARA